MVYRTLLSHFGNYSWANAPKIIHAYDFPHQMWDIVCMTDFGNLVIGSIWKPLIGHSILNENFSFEWIMRRKKFGYVQIGPTSRLGEAYWHWLCGIGLLSRIIIFTYAYTVNRFHTQVPLFLFYRSDVSIENGN